MTTTGSKFLFALSAFGLIAAVVYGLTTDGEVLGVVSGGYKGGVGDHVGYTILLSLGITAGVLGGLMAAFRDADPTPVRQVIATDALPRAVAPTTGSYWPVIAGFGIAILVLGAAVGTELFILGAVLLVIATVEWTVRNWADRATGDDEVNRTIRNRLMHPIEVPVIAVLVIGGVAIGFSRIFLALSKTGASVAAIVLSVLVFGSAAILATRPKVNRNVASALLLACGLAVVVGGIVGAAVGERDFETHEEEHTEEPAAEGETGSTEGESGDGAEVDS